MNPLVFEYLSFPFALRIDDEMMRDVLTELFAACPTEATPTTQFAVFENTHGRLSISVDGTCRRTTSDRAHALAYLLWVINQKAIAAAGNALLLHAAAVERDGYAVLCSGPSGAGKSTLASGFLCAGLAYLTDDVAAVDLESSRVHPAPKPISLARETEILFPSLCALDERRAPYMGRERFVTPGELRSHVGVESSVRVVVFPQYVRGAATQAVEMSGGEALVALAEQSFNFHRLGAPALEALAEVVRPARCLRVTFGRLEDAVATIVDQLDAVVNNVRA